MDHRSATHVDPRHPLLLQEYAVFTPAIDEMARTLGDWIDQRQPGGYIYGPSRFGKSRGVKWHLSLLLSERFQHALPLHILARPPGNQVTESAFWRGWLRAVKHSYAEGRRGADGLREIFKQFLLTRGASNETNLIVLLIDEAQDMTVREWGWLHGLQNDLDLEGYRLSVFSVASHQMGYQYELMARADYAHFAARFMVAYWRFPGLLSQREIDFVLQGYDTASEWPAGSGTSYLAHFAPEAFARGERLSHSASDIWSVLVAMLPPGYRGEENFPMQHLARAVEEVLRRLAAGTSWHEATSPDAWLRAFEQTHLTDHMRLISAGASYRLT